MQRILLDMTKHWTLAAMEREVWKVIEARSDKEIEGGQAMDEDYINAMNGYIEAADEYRFRLKRLIEAQEKAKEACINLAEWTERLVVAKQAALEEAG